MGIRRWGRLFWRAPRAWPLVKPAAAVDGGGPPLTIVVVCYDMARQVGNTLKSLIPPYQRHVSTGDYDVRLVDNGSPCPLSEAEWNIAPNIRYQYISPGEASVNPGVAVNRGVAASRSRLVCVMIDGARMLTPGVVRWGLDLAALSPRTVVDVRPWHLGSKPQMRSVAEGFDGEQERKLLEKIAWPLDGYRLFEVSVPVAYLGGKLLGPVNESTCLFMSRGLFDELGGYDERYATPGGGLGNVDFFCRAVGAADRVFTLLGEGTFHQVHGGAATGLNDSARRTAFRLWRREYERLSRPWNKIAARYEPLTVGHIPAAFRPWLAEGAIDGLAR